MAGFILNIYLHLKASSEQCSFLNRTSCSNCLFYLRIIPQHPLKACLRTFNEETISQFYLTKETVRKVLLILCTMKYWLCAQTNVFILLINGENMFVFLILPVPISGPWLSRLLYIRVICSDNGPRRWGRIRHEQTTS